MQNDSQFIVPENVPVPAQMIGRNHEITAVLNSVEQGTSVFISGTAGIGKTALAATVAIQARDHKSFSGGVAWASMMVTSSGEAGLFEALGSIGRALHIDTIARAGDVNQRRNALHDFLQERPRTLLVLDDVDPGLPLKDLIDMIHAPGHLVLIVTSRLPIELVLQSHLRNGRNILWNKQEDNMLPNP